MENPDQGGAWGGKNTDRVNVGLKTLSRGCVGWKSTNEDMHGVHEGKIKKQETIHAWAIY